MYIMYFLFCMIQVQEWFKNRRKKDRLLQDRAMGRKLPKCHRSHKSTTTSVVDEHTRETITRIEVEDNDLHESNAVGVPSEHTCIPLLQDPRGIEDSGLVACSNEVANTCSGFTLHM